MTAVALVMLFQALRRTTAPASGRVFLGALVLGWGLFNLVEGAVDHHVLQFHHVVESAGLSIFDYLFLASGVVFMAAGWSLIGARGHAAPPVRHTPAVGR